MEGHRTTLVVGAIVAGVIAGGSAAAALPGTPRLDLPTVTTPYVPTVTIPTVSVPTVSVPTTTDVTVPTVPTVTETVPTVTETVPPVPTVPIDDAAPLPELPDPGELPPVPPGAVDVTEQVVTTSSGDATDVPPLPGFDPPLDDVSPFGTVVDSASSVAGPRVQRLIVPENPVAGKPVSFTIAAQSEDQPLSGVSFDFGEGGARFGESACRTRRPSRRGTFSVPYNFAVPGPHVVRFQLSSGTCGAASRVTAGQVTINVARGEATVRAVTGPDAGVLTRGCAHADVLPTRRSRTKVRIATLCLLNAVRRKAGLRALRSRVVLRRIAAEHSRDMVNRRYFDHTEPPHRTLSSRLRSIDWRGTAGENIGYGTSYYATARAMMWAWMHSSGHRTNILDGSFRWIGVAIALGAPTSNSRFGATYTTDFGGR